MPDYRTGTECSGNSGFPDNMASHPPTVSEVGSLQTGLRVTSQEGARDYEPCWKLREDSH